ncbi:MAG: hypothetical protein ACLS5S_07485, partial [Faecalibacterium sp.]
HHHHGRRGKSLCGHYADLPGGFAVPAGRTSATEPAQIVLFTLFLRRFAQFRFQNAVKYAILKAEKYTPPP